MPTAFLTPELITWARERSQASADSVAHSLNVKPEIFVAWEQGTKHPTMRQAQTLARRLRIPFGYLFLTSPPEEELRFPDLRTLPSDTVVEPSPDFVDVIHDVTRKQQWYREHQVEEGAETIPYVGRFAVSDTPESIADDIRGTLGLTRELRESTDSWEQFLRVFITRCEASRIIVMRNGVVQNNSHRPLDIEEFRGFVISDDIAPLIFINGRDAKAAQIFTLAHELAHLWIGSSGVSNPDYRLRSIHQSNPIERLCNRVAAEILLPHDDFDSRWHANDVLDLKLQALASHYRVSTLVVLRQALDMELLNTDDYWHYFQMERDKYRNREVRQSQGDGGDFYATLFSRNSSNFAMTVIGAVAEGRVLHREAARLLNVKVKTLEGISERLTQDRVGHA